MTNYHDVAVIGAGPTAFVALSELTKLGLSNIAIITGAVPDRSASLHAKVASVSYESDEIPGLAEGIRFASGTELYATAKMGGLTAYWGQQFQRYDERDCWQIPGCDRYRDYVALCEDIESNFRVIGGKKLSRVDMGNGVFSVHMPKLLVGTPRCPNANLEAMQIALEDILTCSRVYRIDARVDMFHSLLDGVELQLSNGQRVRAKKVILSAGVVGSMGILMRSIPGIESAEFFDHSPYMLYAFGRFGWLGKAPADFPRHLHARAVMLDDSSGCRAYASVYQMSQAPISLLLATFGLKPALRGCRIGPLADLVRPIQVWTPMAFTKYRVEPRTKSAELITSPDLHEDIALKDFRSQIRSRGAWSLVSSTPAGYGFHYHNLYLKGRNGHIRSASDVISELYGDRLCCIDASTMERIGCRPHTLTEMVHALVKTRKFMTGNW